jgi:peroxiredoxin
MTIKVGDKLPDATFAVMGPDGPTGRASADIFSGRKVVLFAVPGAFTPTCHLQHLPGFLDNIDAFKAKGVDEVACTAVNDVFVMDAWGKSLNVDERVSLLADGSGDFAKAAGLELDLVEAGLGLRSLRYAMLVDDGVVKVLNLEDGGALENSTAEKMLEAL